MNDALTPDEFIARLRDEGSRRYHDQHPFHARMHDGRLDRAALQAWVANRYYYQTRIPVKDALILAKSEDPAFRRMWRRRLVDHDGEREGEGGLALWERLGRAFGLPRESLVSHAEVLPGARAACDAYVELVRRGSLAEAVASSLTELFAPDLMSRRLAAFRAHYPFVDEGALAYFESRVPRARRDGDEALAFVVAHARSRAEQERCVAALVEKARILWALLDAVATHTGVPTA